MFMTPRQNMAAIAASTAEPPFLRISFPISEHFFESVTTACLVYVATVSDLLRCDVKYRTRDPTNPSIVPPPAPILTSLKQRNDEFVKLAAFYPRQR